MQIQIQMLFVTENLSKITQLHFVLNLQLKFSLQDLLMCHDKESSVCHAHCTVDNRCAMASNMGDGRTIQIQSCLCEGVTERLTSGDQCHTYASCAQAAPLECQQNWSTWGTGADRNPPRSRKLPVVSNASPLHLTVVLQHPMLTPRTPY